MRPMKASTLCSLVLCPAFAMITVEDLPQFGVRLVPTSNPDFGAQLSKLNFPQSAVLDAIKPYSVILQNNGNRGIVGYALKWSMTSTDGRVRVKQIYLSVPSALTYPRRNPRGAPPAPPGVRPTGIRFVSPIFSADASDRLPPDSAIQVASQMAQEFSAATSIVVSVDGVAFDDGTFVGPDELHFSDVLQAQISGTQDIKREVDKARSLGQHPDQIFGHLQSVANTNLPAPTQASTPSEWYNFYRMRAAAELVRVWSQAGETAAYGVAYDDFFVGRPRLVKR